MTRVAIVQVASPQDETVRVRRARIGGLIRNAKGADLVVLPELWAPGYFGFDNYADEAESLDGETVSVAREWAKELDCYLHVGSILERIDNGRVHNTAILIDPRGEVIHTYRKIHVFGYRSREAQLLEPGESISTIPTEFGTVGATTCYDLRFPAIWQALVDQGAEVVIVPAAWPKERVDHWRLFTSCRAVEEQVFIIACNAVGTQGSVELGGHSRVIGPWGDVILECGAEEGVYTCEIDVDAVRRVRSEFPVLHDRRKVNAA